MDCFINENENFTEENSQWKDMMTDHPEDISIFFMDTIFSFKSPTEQLSPEVDQNIEEIELESPREANTVQEIKTGSRSFHHNSQKHTVITIKHMVTLKGISGNTQQHQIMQKMWNLFAKGNKKTKEVLSILFGAIDIGNQRDLKLFESYGFGSILKYPMHSIRKAQDMLRKLTLQQMTPERVTEHLQKRRISEKNHFRLYFDGFLEQISDGPLKSRLNKWKSYQINTLKQKDANYVSLN